MKKLILLPLLLVSFHVAFAQSWNPLVNQGIVSPAPLLPVEFNGTGVLSVLFGNTGSSHIYLSGGDELLLIVELSYGVPDQVDPIAAVGGDAMYLFDWNTMPAQKLLPVCKTRRFRDPTLDQSLSNTW